MTFYLWHKNRYSFLFPSQLCVAGNEIVWEKICIYMIDTLCVARQTSQSNATAIWRTNSTNNKSRKKLNSSKNDHSIHARFEWKSQTSQWEPRFQKPQPITIQISQIIMSCHWSPLFFSHHSGSLLSWPLFSSALWLIPFQWACVGIGIM